MATKRRPTARARTIVLAGGLALSSVAFGQYKYVAPDGRVTYSDLPPPSNARVLEQKRPGAPTPPVNPPLPFEVQQAATKYPVTLYTGDRCPPCDEARAFLRGSGVPFTERTVTSDDDIALFRQQSPDGTAPVMTIGGRKAVGFTQSTWSGLLDSAGYPLAGNLPRDYQNPAPTPLSPNTRAASQNVTAGAPATAPRRSPQSGTLPVAPPATPPAAGAPSGFRF